MFHAIHNEFSSEEKQNAAIEAASDPNSSITSGQAQKIVEDQAKASGAQAFSFDPNASAQDKAAQARANVPVDLQGHRKHQVATLATDLDDGVTAGYDLPSPTKEGVVPLSAVSASHSAAQYDKVGWAPRFGEPKDSTEPDNLLDHQTWLEGKLDEKFFGDWYHNAGVIVFACISSWVIAVLGGGLGWVFIVMAICGTYYRTSIRRVRRNFRDDVHREMAKAKLETDTESLEWINNFMLRFWPIYAPVLCATIVSSVDQVLSTSTPAFLDSMRLKFFTLGTKPPRLEHVKTYPRAEDDIVMMDWKFSFNPNDKADMTASQIKNKVNPKVILEVRVGKAMISKALDIIVEDMAFSGLMRVKLKLQIPFPHVERAELCFLGRPTIDYVCKPLGGETFGFDINFVPGLESFIMEQIHANLGPMMYDPNVFPIEVAKMLAGNPVDQAVGVLQITFHGASGLRNTDKFSGTPDPYAVVAINDREPMGKTKTVMQNANPRWTETVNVILTSLKDNLTVTVFDYNEFRKDKELGKATFALEQLHTEPMHENMQLEIIASGRPRGVVQADIKFFPVLEGETLPDGTTAPPPESSTGIVKFTVESAKELDGSKSLIGQLNPYAVLLLNGKEVHVSKKLKRTNNPIWPDATKEMLITDKAKAKLALVIKDDRDIAADPIIGTYQIKLTDVLELMHKGQEWYNLAGTSTGKAKMTLQWKPVAMTDAVGTYGGYMSPIGVMRLHFHNARDLKNVETMGKSDPYVRVMLSGVLKGRTVTFQNNLNPDFDEILYVPIHTSREKLILEVMDEQDIGKDRPLGMVELATSDYVHLNADTGEYDVFDNKKPIDVSLHLGAKASAKGWLSYTASFFPTLRVIDPEETEGVKSALPTSTNGVSGEASSSRTDLTSPRTRSGTVGTITSLHNRTVSTESGGMRKRLNEDAHKQETPEHVAEPPRVRITADDLDKYECGLVVFKIVDGDMAVAGCHLEVIMDDNAFPAYTTAKTRSKQFTFNEIGDAMVRELDLSKITLRLVTDMDKKGEGHDVKGIRSKVTGQTMDVLRRALYTPVQLAMTDKEGLESKVTVSMKFLPVKMKLDPSESLNNSGHLRIDVLDATNLPAADRNGASDPYCKFLLGGKDVYKTKVQKKTLQPIWNEAFDLSIRSRTAAKFEVVVWDWDFGDKADLLGKAMINLDLLEPFQKREVTLHLDGKSGSIRLALLFKPDYVMRSRQGSSTFSGTFGGPSKLVTSPVKGVGKGATFLGGGVARGAHLLGRGLSGRKEKSSMVADGDPESASSIPPVPQRGLPRHNDANTPETPMMTNGVNAITTPSDSSGSAQLSVVSASGFPAGTKLEVRIGLDGEANGKTTKDFLKTKAIKTKTGDVDWEAEKHVETKVVPCTLDSNFKLTAFSHGTFGGSENLGQAVFRVPLITSVLQQDTTHPHGTDLKLGVDGPTGGFVIVRASFQAGHAELSSGQAPDLSSRSSISSGPIPAVNGHSHTFGLGSSHANGNDAESIISARTSMTGTTIGRESMGRESMGSSFRKSILGRRERSVTPGQ